MKLNKRLKENKELNKYIQNEIRANKDLYMGKGVDIKLILRNKRKFLNNFISRNKGLQTEYNELKSENQNFENSYRSILERRDKQPFLEKKFKDNLILYQKKGYKNPNLTTKSNIMKYSPLLMEGQEHMNKFFLQDLYLLNKYLKKIYTYDKVEKYIEENNIKFNDNSEDEDDDNEKEGINSNIFLKKCDLLVKEAYKEKKRKRAYKSLDVNNWFKQDLYADPFLTQGNTKDEQNIFNSKYNDEKNNLFNKEIEKLTNYNNKMKRILDHDNYSFDAKEKKIKRFSVVTDLDNKNILILNSNSPEKRNIFKTRKNKKELTLPYKKRKDSKFEEFYKNIITSKQNTKTIIKNNNKNNVFIIDSKDSINSLKSEINKNKNKNLKSKYLYLKKNIYNQENKHIDKINNLKANNIIKTRNNKNIKNKTVNNFFKNIENIENIDIYKKRFQQYSGKKPITLFAFINDMKEPFHRENIINIFNKKFMLSKVRDINSKYSLLDKYLCKGLLLNE